jgi:hypothetical protein
MVKGNQEGTYQDFVDRFVEYGELMNNRMASQARHGGEIPRPQEASTILLIPAHKEAAALKASPVCVRLA